MSDELPTTPPVSPGSAGLVDRAKGILMQPKAEWQKVAGETTEPMKLLTTYVLPLALIGPIAAFIGSQLFGYGALGFSFKPSIATALTIAVTTFVMAIVGVFVLAFVANFISPKFGGRDNWHRPLVLEQGLKASPWTLTPAEMDFLNSSRMTRDDAWCRRSFSSRWSRTRSVTEYRSRRRAGR